MPRLPTSTACAVALLCAALLAQTPETSFARRDDRAPEKPRDAAHTDERAHATPDFGRLPLTFEANRGQAAPRVRYLARGAGYTLALGLDGALLSLKLRDADGGRAGQLRMSFPGANREARPAGLGLTEAVSNYLKGRDPRRWVTGVENYARVVYAGLYEGVDLVFHGTGGRLEYDFVIAPGADAGRVKVRFDGAARAGVEPDGTLVLHTRAGEVRQPRPVAYQGEGDARTYVACDYTLTNSGEVGFRLGAYDRARELVIDPVLVYSTYLGTSIKSNDIAVDAAGSAYVTGTDSSGDVVVMKLNPSGTALTYSTHVGGGSSRDVGYAIALDAGGNAYVTGRTNSLNFPTSPDAFDKTCGSTVEPCTEADFNVRADSFVFKLDAAGSALAYSTYLGGSGAEPTPGQTFWPMTSEPGWPMTPETDIAVDAGGNAYVAGSTTSKDFPTTPGAFRTTPAASFVTKLNPSGTALVYSTYFPGAVAQAIAVDAGGNAHITGMTTPFNSKPPELPVVNAYQPTPGAIVTLDAFAAKLNPEGSGLAFSTFLGGRAGSGDPESYGDDYGNDIGIDSSGNVYVTGATRSGCFPASNPYAAPHVCERGGDFKEFLVKFNPIGNRLLFSKKLTTRRSADGALSVEPSGVAAVAWICWTNRYDEVCVNRESPSGETLFTTSFGGGGNSEYVSGVVADGAGQVYVTGWTYSTDFPTTPGSFRPVIDGGNNSFVSKFSTASPEAQLGGGSPTYYWLVYEAAEGGGKVTVRVERSGHLASSFSVDYTTVDGTARSASDYAVAAGTLHFAPYEMAKSFDIFITDDAYGPEGLESFTVRLLNPTNGALLGPDSWNVVLLHDNDRANGANPVAPPGFNAGFFVRQHYLDFLNREPDAAGLAHWTGEFAQCNGDAACLEVKRVNVSAAFFLSIEFQETGFYAMRLQRVAFGRRSDTPATRMTFDELTRDQREIAGGLVVGTPGWEQLLAARKRNYASRVDRQLTFSGRNNHTSAAPYVDALFASAGVVPTPAERQAAIDAFHSSNSIEGGRTDALRAVADSDSVRAAEFNAAFVLLQYHGYLRRNPTDPPDADDSGYQFWLGKLNQFGGDYVRAEMVKAFINSDEYRRRFGP
ncbi:MAG TPA: SBBP repeat-containing protein [Pyrinomonadaceae bacterium]